MDSSASQISILSPTTAAVTVLPRSNIIDSQQQQQKRKAENAEDDYNNKRLKTDISASQQGADALIMSTESGSAAEKSSHPLQQQQQQPKTVVTWASVSAPSAQSTASKNSYPPRPRAFRPFPLNLETQIKCGIINNVPYARFSNHTDDEKSPPRYNQMLPEICQKTTFLSTDQLSSLQKILPTIRSFLQSEPNPNRSKMSHFLPLSPDAKEFSVEVSAVNTKNMKIVHITSGLDTVRDGITYNSYVRLNETAFQYLFENIHDIIHHMKQLRKSYNCLSSYMLDKTSSVLANMMLGHLDIGFVFENNEMKFMEAFFHVYNEMMSFNLNYSLMSDLYGYIKANKLKTGWIDTFSVFNEFCTQMSPIMHATKAKFCQYNVVDQDKYWAQDI
jgi:hypothetical protein